MLKLKISGRCLLNIPVLIEKLVQFSYLQTWSNSTLPDMAQLKEPRGGRAFSQPPSSSGEEQPEGRAGSYTSPGSISGFRAFWRPSGNTSFDHMRARFTWEWSSCVTDLLSATLTLGVHSPRPGPGTLTESSQVKLFTGDLQHVAPSEHPVILPRTDLESSLGPLVPADHGAGSTTDILSLHCSSLKIKGFGF